MSAVLGAQVADAGGAPDGWRLAALGEIGSYHNGRGFKKSEWRSVGRPIIRIQNLTDPAKPYNYFDGEAEPRNEVRDGDLLVSWAATLDVFRWRGPDAVLNQHIFKVESYINPDYHYYLLKAAVDALYAQSHGSGMVHVTRGRFEQVPVLVPPLDEQQRIVEIIEELMTQIADGERQLQAAIEAADMYRTAVLHEAFLGFAVKPLGELSEIVTGVTKGRRTAGLTTERPFLRAANIRAGSLDLEEIKSIAVTDREFDKWRLREGDLLMVEGSGSPQRLGQGWLWEGQISDCVHQNHVFRARPDQHRILPRYLAWALQSPSVRAEFYAATKTTSGLVTINKRQVSAIAIPVAPDGEQQRVVDRLEQALRTVDSLKSTLVEQSSAAGKLRQSVLHAALAGKLTSERYA